VLQCSMAFHRTMKTLLIIFAKEPVAGQVKSRLAAAFGPENAARLAAAFLRDVLAEMAPLPGLALALAYSPDTARSFFQELAPAGAWLFPQEGADLGVRMSRALDCALAAGYDAVLLRGSDTPDLPGRVILEAQEVLARGKADVVLGPAADGGYYLVGLKAPAPKLFQDLAWSTPEVLQTTLDRAASLGLSSQLLPVWPDIDTPADLQAFLKRSQRAPAPGWRSRRLAAEILQRELREYSPNSSK
jgi:uncharacterized protein